MQLVIFMGIPATGKSTFYQQRFRETHVRLNLDMLKTRHRERILFHACLEAQQPVVIDNTNPTQADRQRYIPEAKAQRFEVIGYYFQSKVSAAIERNANRERQVPERAIAGIAGRLERPSYQEGFDQLFYVQWGDSGEFLVEEWQE